MISIFGQPGIGGDSLLMPHGNSIHAKQLKRKNSGSKSRGGGIGLMKKSMGKRGRFVYEINK